MLILARANALHLPLASESVACCVTSPPYWGLRDYGSPGQLGLEATPAEYVAHMVDVFREVRRVLRPEGVLWLNLGDSYATRWGSKRSEGRAGMGENERTRGGAVPSGLKEKDLVGIPWRVAFALQADGWWLRSDVIWHKSNPMPEPVTDRPTKAHEYMFLLAKSERYYYDAAAVKEPTRSEASGNTGRYVSDGSRGRLDDHLGVSFAWKADGTGRNMRSVWTLASQPFKGAHYATFPEKLVEPCIKAGSSERGACAACGAPWERVVEREFTPQGDVSEAKGVRGVGEQKPMDASNGWQGVPRGSTATRTVGWQPTCRCGTAETRPCIVLDPFAGTGTVGAVALRHGRRAVCTDLSQNYLAELATRRTSNVQMDLLSATGAA